MLSTGPTRAAAVSPETTLLDYLWTAYVPSRLNLSARGAEQLAVAVHSLDSWRGSPARLCDLSPDMLVAWLRALARSRSPATVNSKRQAVLSLWRHASEHGLTLPPNRVPKLLEPDRLPVCWTLEEIGRLFSAADAEPGWWGELPAWLCWRLGLSVLWDTGARIGELLAARLADVWLDRGVWFVPAANTKGRRRDRLYPLHPDTLALVRQSAEWERERLWPFPAGPRQAWDHYRRILTRAGLPCDRKHLFHCLRRTAESFAARERGLAWAAAAVGHGEDVARRHYVSPIIAPGPALVDALPRPPVGPRLRVV